MGFNIENHNLQIQHWYDMGGAVEQVAFVCFVTLEGKVYECPATEAFDVWEAGSVNAAELKARKAATKHARELIRAHLEVQRAQQDKTRRRNEEYYGKPSGKP